MRHLALIAAAALLLTGCATVPEQTATGDLHDMAVTTISDDTTWSGTVTVETIVIVQRGGHLTIEPGTKVLFRRIDWDGDGIGDGEITVEGRMTAKGTANMPILFASAETEPEAADWKYLHVNFAEGAMLENVRVSHAYSGLQVHYSEATVLGSEFRHNVDGVRFSTAKLTVEGSWMVQNRHGVRYEERGHPARLVGNEISHNEVGIFAVSHCLGKSEIHSNNLSDNRTGAKMGLEQSQDVALPDNYWGANPEVAVENFMDGRADPELGRALVDPVRWEPVTVARPFPIPDDPDWARATRQDR